MVRGSEGDTPERIVKAARDILVAQGLQGLSMRKVASAVGISAPAIYRHFADKDALLGAAVHAGALHFTSYLVQALSEHDARARLAMMCLRYFAFAEENWNDYQLLFVLDCSDIGLAKVDQKAAAATSHTFQLLVDRVKECQTEGVLRPGDPSAQAVFIWTCIHGLASAYLSGHVRVPKDAYRDLVHAQVEQALLSLSAS